MNLRCVCNCCCYPVLLGTVLAMLSGCGQYGDLYLPEKPVDTPQKPPAQSAPTPRPEQDEEQ